MNEENQLEQENTVYGSEPVNLFDHHEREDPAGSENPIIPAPGPVVVPAGDPAHEDTPPSWGQILILFVVAAIIIIADQLTKRLVEQNLPLGTSTTPFEQISDFFQFTHTTNTGAAFGLFPNGGGLFALAAIVVSIVIVIYNFRLPAGHLLLRVALGLQLGGAIGNLIDRARQGYVTDFMDVGPVPIFNIADAAVVTGVALMALIIFWESRQEQKAASAISKTRPHTVTHLESTPHPPSFSTLPTQTTDESGTH